MNRLVCACLLLLCASAVVLAGDPVSDWVGRKFVVLPRPADQQRYGYSCLRRSEGGYIVPSYEECAGKLGTVTRVETPAHGDWRVHLTLDENGKEYVAVGSASALPCLAPAADFDSARARWQGRDVWVTRAKYLRKGDGFPVTDADSVKNLSRMHVESVVPGFESASPLRLSLRQGDQTYFTDIRLRDTNVEPQAGGQKFEDIFLDTDPRAKYVWDENIWQSLENREVATGMTMEQVRLSWGPPEVITRIDSEHCRCEEWEYGGTVVYFKDGKLDRLSDK